MVADLAWDDQVFRASVESAAHAIGKTRTGVLLEAGIGKGWLNYDPVGGRQIDMLEKLMGPLQWGPNDLIEVIRRSFGWQDEPITVAPVSPAASDKPAMATIRADKLHLEIPMRGRLEITINAAEDHPIAAGAPSERA